MRLLTATLVFLFLASCEKGEAPPAAAEFARAGGVEPAAAPEPAAERRIVRTGEMQLAVADLDRARASVLAATKAAGGYVAEDRVAERGWSVQRTLCLRVPAPSFEALVAAVESLGDVGDLHVAANDVTAQCIDVEARVRAKRQMENRYLELVARATNVAEVMQVERELGGVRADIEAMDSKLRALADQVAMSSLTVTLSAPRPEHSAATASDFAASLTMGWTILVRSLAAVLVAWPLLAAAALVLAYRRMRRTPTPAAG